MRAGLESIATVLLLLGLLGSTSCSTPPKAQDDAPEEPPRLTGIVDSQRLRPIEGNRPEKPRTAFVKPAPVTQRSASASASSGGSSSGGQSGAQGSTGANASQSGASGQQGAQGKSGQGEQSSGQSNSQSQGSQNGQSQSGQSSSQGTQGQSQNSSQSSNNSGSSESAQQGDQQSSSQSSQQSSSSASGQQSSSSQGSQSSSQSQGAQSGQSASSSSSSSEGASGQSSQGSQSQGSGQQGQQGQQQGQQGQQSGQQGQQGQQSGQQGQQPAASSTSGVASPGGEAGQGGGDNSYGNDAWKQRPELTAGPTAGAVSAESVLEALRSGSGSGHGAGSGGGGSGGGQTGDPEEASASGANPVNTAEDEAAGDETDATAPSKDRSSSAAGDPQPEAGEVSQAGDASTLEGGTDDETDSDPAASSALDDAQSEATDASASTAKPRPKPEQQSSESFAGLSFPEREQASRPRPKPRPRPADNVQTPTPEDHEPVEPVVQQLRGTWKQVDADPTVGPDFAPAGAAVRVIGIDPDRRRMLSVTAWGSPPSLVLAGEVEAGFRASGRVSIRVRDDLEGGRYPSLPATLPAGLGSYGQPTEEALELRWSVADGRLTLGDRTYAPCDPAELDALLADSGGNSSASTPDAGGVVTSSLDAPEAGSTDFFGLKATGRWFCYIVDTSGSMGKAGKINRLKEELAKSINGLPSDAKFYVLFFSSSTHTLQSKWLSARSSASFTGRLGEVGPKGGTNPRDAINIALTQLDPKPDAIFFMTDGEIPGDCVGQIAKLNAASPKIRIHTVAFGGGAGGGALKTIANQNGGQFRHVP